MITKEEFDKRLKEDTFFEDINEHMDYRIPVLQFYIDNYLPDVFRKIKIIKDERDLTLICQSFNNLKLLKFDN